MRKVVDCFPFFDEFMILDIRFKELYDVVDRFFIVESVQTFSGLSKPTYLSDCVKERYPQYADKIDIVVAPEYNRGDQWDREYFQKNHICKENLAYLDLADDDIILFSDADEIPRRSVVESLKEFGSAPEGGGFGYPTYYYKFNVLTNEYCYRSKFIQYKNFTNHTDQRYFVQPVIPNAGWHFSYIKSPQDIKKKIEAFSHQEFNLPKITNVQNIENSVENMTDLYRRPEMSLTCVPIDDSFPEYIKENKEELSEWIRDCQ